jgi:hypothetical protein
MTGDDSGAPRRPAGKGNSTDITIDGMRVGTYDREDMKSRVLRNVVLSLLALVLCAMMAVAQDQKSLVGKWNMTAETDGEPVNFVLVLKEDDGKLTALLAGEGGEQPVKDFTYEDGVLKFSAPYDGEYYDIELKVKEGKLDGSWSGGGTTGRTSGVKAAA